MRIRIFVVIKFTYMKKLFLLLSFVVISNVQAQQRPKLVVGIVVDQMKMEYLYRFSDDFSPNGFKRLMEKGFVSHKTFGRQHEYFPLVTKENYSGKSIRSLVKNYFEGSFSNVVSYLVKENNISVEELETLLKQIKKQQNLQK